MMHISANSHRSAESRTYVLIIMSVNLDLGILRVLVLFLDLDPRYASTGRYHGRFDHVVTPLATDRHYPRHRPLKHTI